MKRLAIYAILVMATVTAVIFLWQFRSILALFILSLALASTARPPVTYLVGRGLPLGLAILLAYLVGIALVVILLLLLGPPLVAEVQNLASQVTSSYERAWLAWMRGASAQQTIATRLPPPNELFQAIVGSNGELLAQRVLDVTGGVASLLGGLVMALVLSIYWTVDRVRVERLWLSLLPVAQRSRARLVGRAIDEGVGAYIRSELVQGFVGILLLYAGYQVMGLPYPALLALLGGLAWLVPLVGVALTILPVLAAGMMVGVVWAVTAVLYTVTILLLLELIVEPRFFNRRRYSSLLTVLFMLVLVEDFGLLGLIIAPPLAAAVQIFATHWLSGQKTPVLTDAVAQLAYLRERLAQAEATLQTSPNQEEVVYLEMANVADRLDRLLAQAELIVSGAAESNG